MAAVSKDALKLACQLASVCKVGTTASSIQSSLENWFSEIGKDMLFGPDVDFGMGGDAESDSEDEQEEATTDVAKEEASNLLQAAGCTEKGLLITDEHKKMQSDTTYLGEPEKPENEENASSDEESEIEEHKPSNWPVAYGEIRTLQHILENADMLEFKPEQDDHEARALLRLRALTKPIQSFVAYVRVNEHILTRASVLGMKRKKNQHNIYMHELAKARAAFTCSSMRQSRHNLWTSFSQRVCQDIHELSLAVKSEKAAESALVPTRFQPPVADEKSDSKDRLYQLLVVRPLSTGSKTCGGLRFATPIGVWRAGKGKKKTNGQGQKIFMHGLSAHLVSMVHVQLLQPFGDVDGKSLTVVAT